MEKRELKSGKRYILAFVISTIILAIIILVSYSLSMVELQRVSNLQNNLAYNIFQDKLEYTFFNNTLCSNESFGKVSSDLGIQGGIINDLEQKFGKNNQNVLDEKKFYTLVELEHLEFVQHMNAECGSGVNTILFFYSNDPSEVSKSEELGNVLSTVYSKHPNLVIYSFDVNLNSTLISQLKEKYNITQPLTLIINGNVTLRNPGNINEIERYLTA